MKTRFPLPLSAGIAIAIGLVVLAGYFFQTPVLVNLRNFLLRWGLILAAVALIVGIVNLWTVHWRKLTSGQRGGVYSLVLVVSLAVTVMIALVFGPDSTYSMWLFNYIQVPAETSLMALLVIVLVYAGARVLKRRMNVFTLLFVAAALLVLISKAPVPGISSPALAAAQDGLSRIVQIPAVAGARGLLLGIALGTVATGLRILMGADRPYED